MTRIPLRPLPRILPARQRGEDVAEIEQENLRARHEEMRDRDRRRAEGRLVLLAVLFVGAYSVIGGRMALLAHSEPTEPRMSMAGSDIIAQRADIVDRHGRVLATNLETNSLYARPQDMVDPERAVEELTELFPDLDKDRLLKDFTGNRKFLWIKKTLSPEQQQAVHDIGEPGLLFGPREMRLYPNGKIAAHILGGASFGREGVHAAEVVGTAGIEKFEDERLRDPAQGNSSLELSLDLSVQAALEDVLNGGMQLMNAKGAAAVLQDIHTGEVIALASLPDFDPNDRPSPLVKGSPSDSPLFNRAVQGVYELGSTFKIFAMAQALELGLVSPTTMVNTKGPMYWGRFKIRDFHNYGAQLTATQVIVKSSNIGTAHIAQMLGGKRQQEFMKSLGFFEPTPLEIVEASGGQPLLPKNWSELSTMTISYGHGLSVSPLHLAAAYSAIANGGIYHKPTLLKLTHAPEGRRVISERTAQQAREMLRKVVSEGTASLAKDTGYEMAGKTGTADKPKENGGGYYRDKVIATFASFFPASDPKYTLIVTLDEPVDTSGSAPRRTAGWTSVPVGAAIVERIAPLMGMRPVIAPVKTAAISH